MPAHRTSVGDPWRRVARLLERAVARLAQGGYPQAEALALEALEVGAEIVGSDHPALAPVLFTLGKIVEERGDYPRAEAFFQRAVRNTKRDASALDLRIQAISRLAGIHRVQARYRRAERLYLQGASLGRETLRPAQLADGGHPQRPRHSLQIHGRIPQGSRLYRRALAILEKQLGPEHPEVATLYHNLGGLEHARGRHARGEPYARCAVAIRVKALGPNHPIAAADLAALAGLLDGQGKFDESEAIYLRVLPIFERVYGPEHYEVAVTLNNLAAVYQAQGNEADAEPLYRRALAIKERILGAEHPDVAMTCNNLAVLCKEQGKLSESAELYRRALAIFETSLGPTHPKVAACLTNFARLLGMMNCRTEARKVKERIRRLRARGEL